MERDSIERLYRQYGSFVLRRARVLLGDEQAAKDALQEVFVKAIKAGEQFRGDSSPVTWLYRITTNHCLNSIRDGGRRRALLAEQGPPAEEHHRPALELRLTMRDLLPRIPEDLREIAIYYFVDEMNQDEIASLLGLSRRTIGNRLEAFRAAAQAALGAAAEAT
jgi:RNA polymerase sigma-70 factor (ECF subfamily)